VPTDESRSAHDASAHDASAHDASAHDAVVAFNARLGVVLFLVYLLLYVGFIYLSAFQRERMATEVIGRVNLAVVYGFALIAAAFVMALLYMVLCRREPAATDTREGGR
jgi:uncharacterized membrane protein (DUF485 family)